MTVWDYDPKERVAPRSEIICDECGRECGHFYNGKILQCELSIDGKDYCSDCVKMMYVQNNLCNCE